MGLFTPSAAPEAPPPVDTTPVAAPKRTDAEVTRSKLAQRRRSLANFGRTSTIATSSQGLTTEATTARKSLLGV